jgi:hypothetical protein
MSATQQLAILEPASGPKSAPLSAKLKTVKPEFLTQQYRNQPRQHRKESSTSASLPAEAENPKILCLQIKILGDFYLNAPRTLSRNWAESPENTRKFFARIKFIERFKISDQPGSFRRGPCSLSQVQNQRGHRQIDQNAQHINCCGNERSRHQGWIEFEALEHERQS